MRIPLASARYHTEILFGGIAIHGLALAVPVFMMQLYDRFLPNNSVSSLAWFAIATVVAILLETLLKVTRNHWANWHTERTIYNSRRWILETILSSPITQTQLRDVFPALRVLLTDSYKQLSFFIADIPFGILYYVLIAFIHPVLCAYLLGVGLGGLLVLHASRAAHGRVHDEALRLQQERKTLMDTTLQATAELKALGAEELVARYHSDLHARIAANQRKSDALESRKMLLSKSLDALSVFGPIVIGGLFVIQGELTVGALTACVLLSRRSLTLLQHLGERWYADVEILTARRTVEEVTGRTLLRLRPIGPKEDLVVEPQAVLDVGPLVLRRGIRAAQEAQLALAHEPQAIEGDDRPVLKVEPFRLLPGDWVAIHAPESVPVGEFFQALRGTHPFFSGEVRLGGADLARFSRTEIGRHVVLVPDRAKLFPGTFLDNIASFDPALMGAAQKQATLLGLDGSFERLERGYETPVTEASLAALSPGVLQRLALARALTQSPQVLLLDNFDGTMDQESRKICEAVLANHRRDLIVFYRGQDERFLRIATWKGMAEKDLLVWTEVRP